MTDQTTETKSTNLTAWKAAAKHFPLCPSGVRVGLKIPDLPRLIEAGEIPQHLLGAALESARKQATADIEDMTTDDIIANAAQEREWTDTVVLLTVVEPKLKEADLTEIPYEDKLFIAAVATRGRDLDAEGEHIAGLTSSEKFRRFREIGEFAPTLEGA